MIRKNLRTTLRLEVFMVLCFLAAASCGKAAPGGTLSEHGLQVTYPDGWTAVQKENVVNDIRYTSITIDGPGNAFVELTHYHSKIDATLERYSTIMLEGRVEQFKKTALKSTPTRVTPTSVEVAGKRIDGLRHEFEVSLIKEPVPHRAEYVRLEGVDSILFVSTHAPIEEWPEAETGFRVILGSLKIQ